MLPRQLHVRRPDLLRLPATPRRRMPSCRPTPGPLRLRASALASVSRARGPTVLVGSAPVGGLPMASAASTCARETQRAGWLTVWLMAQCRRSSSTSSHGRKPRRVRRPRGVRKPLTVWLMARCRRPVTTLKFHGPRTPEDLLALCIQSRRETSYLRTVGSQTHAPRQNSRSRLVGQPPGFEQSRVFRASYSDYFSFFGVLWKVEHALSRCCGDGEVFFERSADP